VGGETIHVAVCDCSELVCTLLLVKLFWVAPHGMLVFITVLVAMSGISWFIAISGGIYLVFIIGVR